MTKKIVAIVIAVLMVVVVLAACTTAEPAVSSAAPASASEEVTAEASEASSETASASTEDSGSGEMVSWPDAQAPTDGITIKFIPMSTASAYWQAVKQGAEDAAAEFGEPYGGVTVLFEGTTEDVDHMGQVDIINNSVAQGVDALMVAVNDPTVPHDAIGDAIAAGVPVLLIDQTLADMNATAFLGTDCVAMTENLGKYMAENILSDSKGSYMELMYDMTSNAAMDRREGFVKAMNEYAPDMTDAGSQNSESDIALTQNLVTNEIQKDPNLKCVFATNDRSSIGSINAFHALDLKDDVKLCGVDVNLDLLKAMREGTMQAISLQQPYFEGYQGVQEILDLLSGKSIPKMADSGSFLLTPDIMDTPEAVSAIQSYLDGYKPEDSKLD